LHVVIVIVSFCVCDGYVFLACVHVVGYMSMSMSLLLF